VVCLGAGAEVNGHPKGDAAEVDESGFTLVKGSEFIGFAGFRLCILVVIPSHGMS
jgi:hypothetical protein